MRYVVDGYNVIGQLDDIDLKDPQKETLFLAYLKARCQEKDHILVVFDGKQKSNTFGIKECYGAITYYFTAYGQTADDYIIELMTSKKHPENTIVVSSDRDILFAVKKCHVKTVTVPEFKQMFVLPRSGGASKPDPSDTDTDYWLSRMS